MAAAAKEAAPAKTPVLWYFNLRARAESIRMIAAHVGFKYEDRLISFKDWPTLKPQTPKGAVPILVTKRRNKDA
eukprot:TRINITY_DN1491_c0_g1_i1.p1 TRINITY_DN1491_c0_g1~~TRINITY_DN1491_c0_g1_i1.p1  ORF type:complete len:74 (+),score=16.47 TRINITY_DN1491_c0_g1_i1:211-432(+)